MIADNRLALEAGWDEELLALELAALSEAGYDLALTGFDDAAVEEWLATDVAVRDKAGEGQERDEPDGPLPSPFMLRVTTLNLNGIRSAVAKGLTDWVAQAAPDVLCVQELKAQPDDLVGRLDELAGRRGYVHCAARRGYAGVGIYTRLQPSDVVLGIGVPEFDDEGRWIELRFDTPARRFSIVSVYFPSGSSGEERQQAKFRFLELIEPVLLQLGQQRHALVCGDVNIAHTEKDLKNWRGNQQNSGFLPEERAWVSRLLGSGQWVDVYRCLHPDAEGEGYTWWSNRGQAWAKNVGWRIDVHWATPQVAATARRAEVYKAQRFSDHAPLTIEYDWAL